MIHKDKCYAFFNLQFFGYQDKIFMYMVQTKDIYCPVKKCIDKL